MALQYNYPRYPRHHGTNSDPLHGSDSDVAALSDLEDDDEEDEDEGEEEEEEELPYPGFVAISMKYLDQTSRPRSWCLAMITNPYPFYTAEVN
ncbi:voltage-dependent T-type calcium channel subunit alpha-1G-like [Macrosteles quadrilineatus]|uniref:voltage-dependent T-type calcium channel subunit alpha-1G-like n=1 Tax=Macrosteles quadrilineatus TaxID=74068 RepID=UPI0023E17459|nr:voltage-dependent T-type calcium channel subunit alpha-1G-like [Macrosteles quadrilineatus]